MKRIRAATGTRVEVRGRDVFGRGNTDDETHVYVEGKTIRAVQQAMTLVLADLRPLVPDGAAAVSSPARAAPGRAHNGLHVAGLPEPWACTACTCVCVRGRVRGRVVSSRECCNGLSPHRPPSLSLSLQLLEHYLLCRVRDMRDPERIAAAKSRRQAFAGAAR